MDRRGALGDGCVSAIIVNYNGSKVLNGCISSLLKQSHPPVEIILVDNGSTDDSVRTVKERFPEVEVLECRANFGYAEGNNIGAKVAKGEFLALVNNDAKFDFRCLEALANALSEEPALAAVQGKVLKEIQPPTIDSIGSYITPTGFLYHRDHNGPDIPACASSIFSAKGVCMLVRSSTFNSLGGFDPSYFAYFEETDFCWRAWIAGYKVKLIPSSITYHMLGYTSAKFERGFIDYHSFKNRICSIIKNCGTANLPFMLISHLALCLLIAGALAVSNQPKRARGILKALAWNIENLGPTIKKRTLIQNHLRKVSDRDVFRSRLISPGLRYYARLFAGY